jgi:hypothetical protein
LRSFCRRQTSIFADPFLVLTDFVFQLHPVDSTQDFSFREPKRTNLRQLPRSDFVSLICSCPGCHARCLPFGWIFPGTRTDWFVIKAKALLWISWFFSAHLIFLARLLSLRAACGSGFDDRSALQTSDLARG